MYSIVHWNQLFLFVLCLEQSIAFCTTRSARPRTTEIFSGGHHGSSLDSDWEWSHAEKILKTLPSIPSADLPPDVVALTVCRSLQWVDYPTEGSGLERCFDFLTWECRKCVTGRQGGDTVEQFCEYGLLAPALQVFMGARKIAFGEATKTPAHPPLRGGLYSVPVTVEGAPILSVRYPSGLDRSGVASPPQTQMILRLEEQRRPPQQGCWLVKEIMDPYHAFDGDLGNSGVGA